ncbi:hypothetical protein B0H34DRAFT_668474 [Crassisporium funariophilum]|nr:hypothetical protein B0H34DRAFT_668474 [Crassisporium funariophilum]
MEKSQPLSNPEVTHTSFTLRQIPTLPYTIQNILISIGSVVASTASLLLTIFVILPMSMMRAVMPRSWLMSNMGRCEPGVTMVNPRRKVVLIVGASRGIGYNVLKQYAVEPGTLIIAASRSIENLKSMIGDLGQTAAEVQLAEIDITAPRKNVVERIRGLDKEFGPITHLYEVSGISNHLQDDRAWGLDVTAEMINVNVVGTVTSVLTIYELMKERGFGKICIIGSVAGLFNPANMISYASTKAIVNTFSTSLRILAAPCGVDVVTVQPGFIDTRMTLKMRGQGSTVPGMEFASAEGMAKCMKSAVETGGVGVVSYPMRQSVMMNALQAVNPICQEIGGWVSMKTGIAGNKIS